MKSFQDECSELASLETFDPAAFQGDAHVPKELCNFVLSLALIYNDCKDITYSRVLLGESRPEYPVGKNRRWGAWFGIDFHIFRLVVGLLHELLDLIRDNQEVIEHPFFQSVLKQLSRPARDAWQAVVTVASGATPVDTLGKRLLLIRNKVSAHYDPRAIVTGYKYHFTGSGKLDERAFISRGDRMATTRFYFADAAATGYLRSIVGKDQSDEVMKNVGELLNLVNHALMSIVNAFIQKRGYAYRAAQE